MKTTFEVCTCLSHIHSHKITVDNDLVNNLQDYYLSELSEYQFYHSSRVCVYQFFNSSKVNVYKINFIIHYSSGVLSLLIYSLFISAMHVALSSNNIVRVSLFEVKPQDSRIC